MAARIGLDAVRELMRRYLDEDGDKRSILAEGGTVEEALQSAAVQLDCPVARLEYEVLERGTQGFIGLGSKRWKISAYEGAAKKKVESAIDDSLGMHLDVPVELQPMQKDQDGQVFVRFAPDGVLMKVTPPEGKGRKATERVAVERLHMRAVHDFDEQLVRDVIKAAANEWVVVGRFIANPADRRSGAAGDGSARGPDSTPAWRLRSFQRCHSSLPSQQPGRVWSHRRGIAGTGGCAAIS